MTQPALSEQLAESVRPRVRCLLPVLLMGVITLALAGGLAWWAFRTETPPAFLPGQSLALALSSAGTQSPGVQTMSGAYVPGEGLFLYSRLTVDEQVQVRSWAVNQLVPYADRLAALPAQETLTWVIDYGTNRRAQEVIRVPIRRATDVNQHRYLSMQTDVLAPTLAPTALVPTLLPPVVQPTEAPMRLEPVATLMPAGGFPAASEATTVYSGDFAEDATGWRVLSGDWQVRAGAYVQRDASGYDYMTLFGEVPLSHYSIEAQMVVITGTMGGGFVYNAPSRDVRLGAQVVDITDGGRFVRWGSYNERGDYVYEGGAVLDPPIRPGQGVRLRLVTHAGVSVISVGGREVGTIMNRSIGGYVGLTTSLAQVAFDEVRIVALPAR